MEILSTLAQIPIFSPILQRFVNFHIIKMNPRPSRAQTRQAESRGKWCLQDSYWKMEKEDRNATLNVLVKKNHF